MKLNKYVSFILPKDQSASQTDVDVKKPEETSAVVLENLPDDVNHNVLTLLVENISSLSENDFSMELIPELRKAVVTFKNPSGKLSYKIYILYFYHNLNICMYFLDSGKYCI